MMWKKISPTKMRILSYQKDDTGDFTTKLDTFDLVSSVDKGNEKEKGGSSSQDVNMHYPSSHGKGNEDNSMISLRNLDEHHESPKNDESQGSTWKPDTGANHHATPDLSSLDNSEAYFGRVYTHYPPNGTQ
ncbi:hypothetical protein L6452_03437 [Arctium lappa]|uniref:Uncharacterized protein n=1 Tax=Arctium lappa TaxID=4217 RepID=A0ACB9FN84_ARCLA|nr:hypothetical protein L6452_03437 [Arctium lappa]